MKRSTESNVDMKTQGKRPRLKNVKSAEEAYDPPAQDIAPPPEPDAPSKEITSGEHFNRGTDTPAPNPHPKPSVNVLVRDAKIPLPQQIAGDHMVVYNWKWPGAEQDFPQEPWMRNTRHYYPNARGGGLAVDEPKFDNDKLKCERKAKFLKARGIRYLVYSREMTLMDAERNINDGLVSTGREAQAPKSPK